MNHWQNNDDELHSASEWANNASQFLIVLVTFWFLFVFLGGQVIPHFLAGGR